MEKRSIKRNVTIIVGVFLLVLVTFGFTYAYFTTSVNTTGSGGSTTGTTAKLENTELKLEPAGGGYIMSIQEELGILEQK